MPRRGERGPAPLPESPYRRLYTAMPALPRPDAEPKGGFAMSRIKNEPRIKNPLIAAIADGADHCEIRFVRREDGRADG